MNHPQAHPPVIEDQILRESILKTLSFFDQFQFPLTPEEILENLYRYSHPLHIKALRATLQAMEEQGEIEQLKGYVALKGRVKAVEKRKAHEFISEKLWHRAKFYTHHLRRIPFIRMVAVCNNLAYNNAREESDIDLFIVIENGRMWLARLIVTLTLQFFGVRRHGSHVAGRFCLSFFVTPAKLNMGELALEGEDPYLAYWVKTLSPLYGPSMYEEFKKANKEFLRSYGLKFSPQSTRHLLQIEQESGLKNTLEFLLKGPLGNAMEWLLKKTYKRKTLKSMNQLDERANVIVSDEILKFHNEDRRTMYRNEWKKRWKGVNRV